MFSDVYIEYILSSLIMNPKTNPEDIKKNIALAYEYAQEKNNAKKIWSEMLRNKNLQNNSSAEEQAYLSKIAKMQTIINTLQGDTTIDCKTINALRLEIENLKAQLVSQKSTNLSLTKEIQEKQAIINSLRQDIHELRYPNGSDFTKY